MKIACVAGIAIILSGCASTTERVASPPAIVLDPPPRAGTTSIVPDVQKFASRGGRSPTYQTQGYQPPAYAPPANQRSASQPPIAPYTGDPAPARPFTAGVADWLRTGRGWTWGAANHGPARDQGLDRLMAETLGSSVPHYSNENPTEHSLISNETWLYPTTPVPGSPSRSNIP